MPYYTSTLDKSPRKRRFNTPEEVEEWEAKQGVLQTRKQMQAPTAAQLSRFNMTSDPTAAAAEYARGQQAAKSRASLEYAPGTPMGSTSAGKAFYRDVFPDEKKKTGGSVWEQQGLIGGKELSASTDILLDQYVATGAITKEEAGAFKVIARERPYDVLDWLKVLPQSRGKAFEAIPAKVKEQEALLPGQKRKAEETAAASTASRINTERGLAEVSAETAGIVAGGKAKGERKAGQTLPATNAERLGDFTASLYQMEELTNSLSNPNAPQGPIQQFRTANPLDWQAQAKQQLVKSTKQLVGKALEGGVLRKEDEEKYDKILPVLGDTYKSAVAKSANLVTMLNNAYRARLEALGAAGYDVSGYDMPSKGTDGGKTRDYGEEYGF